MTDYKATLNLPFTEFPLKANLAQREPTMREILAERRAIRKIREQRHGRQKFILHDGHSPRKWRHSYRSFGQ